MFRLVYENEYGRIEFGGGDAPIYRTIEVTGLGLPDREFSIVTYAGEAGQQTKSVRDLSRVITVNADVLRPRQLQQELSKTIRTLYHPGTMTISSGLMRRKIACRCTDMDDIARKGRDMANITLQFTCDNPYFTDVSTVEIGLFQRQNAWEESFTLPCVFTERTSRLTVSNEGDVQAEPVFTIYNNASGAVEMQDSEYGIELLNHTTGQRIKLDYHTQDGETVIIDVKNREITSSVNGDILNNLSDDTYLNNFWLQPGENDIEAVNYNTSEDISVLVSYDNQYIEAVY